jgi:hypothetical protein
LEKNNFALIAVIAILLQNFTLPLFWIVFFNINLYF